MWENADSEGSDTNSLPVNQIPLITNALAEQLPSLTYAFPRLLLSNVTLTQVNIYLSALNPTSGPPGTTVKVLGTFWPPYSYWCDFGGTLVQAHDVSLNSLTCVVPESSSGGSGEFSLSMAPIQLLALPLFLVPITCFPGLIWLLAF